MLTLRVPSSMRSTGDASARPIGAAGRVLLPKARHLGCALSSSPPSPSDELATGAKYTPLLSRYALCSAATWP